MIAFAVSLGDRNGCADPLTRGRLPISYVQQIDVRVSRWRRGHERLPRAATKLATAATLAEQSVITGEVTDISRVRGVRAGSRSARHRAAVPIRSGLAHLREPIPRVRLSSHPLG